MRTKIFILVFICLSSYLSAQKYISKNGHIWFYSFTPMENIEAHNKQVVSVLDPSTGDIQFSLLIKSFEFKTALMQEHFNENYMESDKIPKAGFVGKITNLDKINFTKDGDYEAIVSGDLTIHGVKKPLTIKGTISVKDKFVNAKSKFTVAPKDYEIKIPSIVEEKIAKEIDVNVDISYNQN